MQEQMSEMYAKLTTLEGKLKKTQKTEGMGEMTEYIIFKDIVSTECENSQFSLVLDH